MEKVYQSFENSQENQDSYYQKKELKSQTLDSNSEIIIINEETNSSSLINLNNPQQDSKLEFTFSPFTYFTSAVDSDPHLSTDNIDFNVDLNGFSDKNKYNSQELIYQSSEWDQQSSIICKQKKKQKKIENIKNAIVENTIDSDFRIQKLCTVQKNYFSPETKFYLFADQIIDINFIKSGINGSEEQYLKEQQTVCVFKNIIFVNKLSHRTDNKFIEIQPDLFNSYLENIDQIIYMIQSLGHFQLNQMVEGLKKFWNGLQLMRQNIYLQSMDYLFQQHKKQRQKSENEAFIRYTQNLDQNKVIYYSIYKVNYEKRQFDSCNSGYSPGLVNLLAGNSIAFKDHVLKKGFIDPIHSSFRHIKSYELLSTFLEQQKSKKETMDYVPDYHTEITTLDQFCFPCVIKSTVIPLCKEYDEANGLKFFMRNVLMVYEFQLQDEDIFKQLQKARIGTKYSKHIVKNENLEINDIKQKYSDCEFFKKYYKDDIQEIAQKGIRWLNQNDAIDLPKSKKVKKNNQF